MSQGSRDRRQGNRYRIPIFCWALAVGSRTREIIRLVRIVQPADVGVRFDAIELWIDPDPNAQLILIWLLQCFRPHDAIVSKLNLVQADVPIGELMPERLLARQWPAVKIVDNQLELASSVWRAWREQRRQDWLGLLSKDLGALPQLRPAVVALLDELPRSR